MTVAADSAVLVAGSVSLDLRRYVVRIGEQSWPIRKRDAELLKFFMETGGRIVSRDELTQALWGHARVSPRAVETSLTRLRQALRERVVGRIIRTLHSSGYQFTGVPEPFRIKGSAMSALLTRRIKRVSHEATHPHR